MRIMEQLLKQEKDEKLRIHIVGEMKLPDFNEWKSRWKNWIDELIRTEKIYWIAHRLAKFGRIKELTPETVEDTVKDYWNVLEWLTMSEKTDSGIHWRTCQDYLIEAAKQEFDCLIYGKTKNLFAEYGYQSMEDAMRFFNENFYRIYHTCVYGLLADYTAADFIAAFTEKRRRSVQREISNKIKSEDKK